MRLSRFGGVIICVLAAALVMAPGASAGLKRINTTVKLNGWSANVDGEVFADGQVKSANRRCRANRKVTLNFAGGLTATSDGTGAFAFNLPYGNWKGELSGWPFPPGAYVASIGRKRFGRRGHRKLCKADTATLTVENVAGPGVDGSPNDFDDPTNTFSGQFALLPPCDVNRLWDFFVFDGLVFTRLTDPQFQEVGTDGGWAYVSPDEPGPGSYDALLYPQLGFPGEQTGGGNLTLSNCGAGDTVDVVIS